MTYKSRVFGFIGHVSTGYAMRFALLAASLSLLVVSGHNAFAQAVTVAEPTNNTAMVTVPYGSWVGSLASSAQEVIVSVILALVAWTCRRLPAAVGTIVRGLITQQLVERAVSFGVNTVVGATAGKALSFSTGTAVVNNALNYIVEGWPTWVVKWLGGRDTIKNHIIALVPLEAEASLSSVTKTVPTDNDNDLIKAGSISASHIKAGSF